MPADPTPRSASETLKLSDAVRRLRDVLASIYREPASAARIVDDAGLDAASIQLADAAVITIWHNVVQGARAQGRLADLTRVVSREYPTNAGLAAACAAVGELVTRPEGPPPDALAAKRPHEPVLPRALPVLWTVLVRHGRTTVGLAVLLPLLLILSSLLLGVAGPFEGVSRSELAERVSGCRGFVTSINWGPACLVGLPLMTVGVRWFLQEFERGLRSASNVMKRNVVDADIHDDLVSLYGGPSFRALMWALPVVLVLANLGAEYRDVFSPWLRNATSEYDWSNCTPLASPARTWMYVAFNLATFVLPSTLTWLAFTALFVALAPLAWLTLDRMRNSAGGPRSIESRYVLAWAYGDPTGRCGLADFHRACLAWAALQLVAGVVSLTSFAYNRSSDVSVAQALLIVCNLMMFMPWVLWVVLPIQLGFPDEFPADQKPEGYARPQRWPIGDGTVTLGWFGLLVAVLLLGVVWSKDSFRPFLYRKDQVVSARPRPGPR